jgi:hypothetical protein
MISELGQLEDGEPDISQLSRLYLEDKEFQVQVIGDRIVALGEDDLLNPALVVLDFFGI